MPIRRLTIQACAYGVMLAGSSQVLADASAWNGSYAAEGGCYCAGSQSQYIDSLIVPTPVGGQSVKQVCERVGNGPTLQKNNGKFNFTVYPDAQCGNGPFPDATAKRNKQCIGHLGVSGEDCAARGPRWDLTSAYAKAAENPKPNSSNSIVTGGSRYIVPPVKQVAEKNVNEDPAINTPIAEIARTRSDAKKVAKRAPVVNRAPKVAVPETREQIRARQLEHLAAARQRANLAESTQSSSASKPVNAPLTADPIEPLKSTNINSANKDTDSVEGLLPNKTAASTQLEKIKPKNSTGSKSAAHDRAKVAKSQSSKKASVDSVANTTKTPAVTKDAPGTVAAFKVPADLSFEDPDFNYVEAAPVTYDFGGTGISVAASKTSHDRVQYFLSAAAADTYREAALGMGLFLKPVEAERVTLMARAGVEYGLFNFRNSDVKADVSDSGLFVGLATQFTITRQFELQAGVSYSNFFEGDVVGFGAAFYQLTRHLDLTAKAEAGDNDLFGFGIRYHY